MSNSKTQYETLSDHELLVKLAKQGRHRLNLLLFLAACVLITSCIVIYQVYSIAPKITETMEAVTKMAGKTADSMQKIDQIDLETMNQAIADFSKVAKIISGLFGQ
ncbi:MAG: hypothetical protein K6A40_01250 [Solobacterium sp.]|nr:hypothetical protein [Solobacterium sp.]